MGLIFLISIMIPFVILILARNQPLKNGTPGEAILIIGIVECIISSLMLSLWYGTFYEIDSEYFYYRISFLKGKIPINAIHLIKTKSKRSTVNISLSNDMMMIKYNTYDDITISPVDKEGFINALKLVNPNIVIEE